MEGQDYFRVNWLCDTLLTLAGMASFTADQRQLDDRIRGIIG